MKRRASTISARTAVLSSALVLVALIVMLGPNLGTSSAESGIAGKWRWQGAGGWQRIELDLNVNGKTLSGTITMGSVPPETLTPPSSSPVPPDLFWKYFFEPVVSNIANGVISGNSVSFQQVLIKAPPGANRSTAQRAKMESVQEKMMYRGKLEGDRIILTREYQGRNETWSLGNHKTEFTVERVR